MLDMYNKISKGIVIAKENYFNNRDRQIKEAIDYRKNNFMEELPKSTIIRMYEQMESLASNNDSVIITPITNKWKDTHGNMDGVGTIALDMEGTLEY